MDIYKHIEKINEILENAQIFAEVTDYPNLPVIIISITWGDWKHDHLYCDHLMNENGYNFLKEMVTEEDGSDCYSADRYYIITREATNA